jgi:hypothetical protein
MGASGLGGTGVLVPPAPQQEAKDEPWTPDDMAYRPNGLPQRPWVGLTPEEIDEIIETAIDPMDALLQTMDKLKQKNGNA